MKVDFSKVKPQVHCVPCGQGRHDFELSVGPAGGLFYQNNESRNTAVQFNDPADWDKLAEAAKSIADAMREAMPKKLTICDLKEGEIFRFGNANGPFRKSCNKAGYFYPWNSAYEFQVSGLNLNTEVTRLKATFEDVE
jgi:hypothetical protein